MIECVPHISEGTRPDVIERLVDAAGQGGTVVDVHQDVDHDRTVLSVVGDREEMIASIAALARAAIEAIDLRCQRGVHPRMGALDVVPFVPFPSGTMAECVAAARKTGRILGRDQGLPVYLYGEAATRENRRNLADVRRGGCEGVTARLALSDHWPDFGPSRIHPTAGAVAVGARDLLVAYNVTLASQDLASARAIAKAIRASSPNGLPGVKALGLWLESKRCVQVSMNLTQIGQTDVPTAFKRVVREAATLGIDVGASEVVGLAPAAAFGRATAADLLLPHSILNVTLEERLRQHGLADR